MERKTLTQQQVLTIPAKIKEGQTNTDIAAEFGVHVATINRWLVRLRKAGHDVPVRKGGRRKMEL